MFLRLFLIGLILTNLTACSSMALKMSPGKRVIEFEGQNRSIVLQSPVRTYTGFAFMTLPHVLGFKWDSLDPDIVTIRVGITHAPTIGDVIFILEDGAEIRGQHFGMPTVDYSANSFDLKFRVKPFKISLDDFRKIATADVVTMKVQGRLFYTDAVFGKKESKTIVDTRFAPFLEEVDRLNR